MLGKAAARLLGGRVEPLELEQPPVPDDRQEDLVAVDAQVVDPGLGDLRGLRRNPGIAAPGISKARISSTMARTAADGWILSAAARMSR